MSSFLGSVMILSSNRRWGLLSWDQRRNSDTCEALFPPTRAPDIRVFFGIVQQRCVAWKRGENGQFLLKKRTGLLPVVFNFKSVTYLLRGNLLGQIAQNSSSKMEMIVSRHNSKFGAVVTGPPQRQKQQEQNFVRILGIFVTGPPQRQIQAKLSSSLDFFNDWLRSGSSKTCSKFSK